MQKGKEEEIKPEERTQFEDDHVICGMCGCKIKPGDSSWQEDDDGAVLCQDCWAERESCGCSD